MATVASTRSIDVQQLSAERIGFAFFSAAFAWLILRHSPWFDEAQALLIARAPLKDLLPTLKYEGHPALWYLWLGLIDRLDGASPISLPLAQLPVTLGLLALIWFRSPFPPLAKLLLSLGYYIGFEYGVISRSYGLGALLLLAAVPLRRSIWSWVCLALAANTSVHDAIGAGALGLFLFLERPQWKGPVIVAVGIALAALTVFPRPHDLILASGAPTDTIGVRFVWALTSLGQAALPTVPMWRPDWSAHLIGFPGVIIGMAFLPLVVLALRTRRAAVPLAALCAALLLIGVFTYGLGTRHVGVIFVYALAVAWVDAEEGVPISPLMWGWIALVAACGLPLLVSEVTRPFTHAKAIAAWIGQEGLEQETWGAWPGRGGVPLASQLGRPVVNLEEGCSGTFLHWNYPHEKVKGPLQHIQASGVRYVISEQPLAQGQLLAHFGEIDGVLKYGTFTTMHRSYDFPAWIYRFEQPAKAHRACR